MSAKLRVASGDAGVMLMFDGSADNLANFDPQTNDFRKTGWRDSFLALTGYRTGYLPFEFIRQLAWHLGAERGVFAGCVLHRTAQSIRCAGYDATSLAEDVPRPGQIEPSWMRTDADATVYFPRSIDDMCPIVNEHWNDAIVYLGFTKAAGFIERIEEDDEWLVVGDVARTVRAVTAVAESMGLPIDPDATFDSGVAEEFSRNVPEIEMGEHRIHVERDNAG